MPHRAKLDLADLIATLEEAISEVPPQEAPRLLGDLERLKAALWTRMMSTPAARDGLSGTTGAAGDDQLLTVNEAAQKLGVSRDWLYRHSQKLAFTVRVGKRHLRFSLRGIEKYISQRRGR